MISNCGCNVDYGCSKCEEIMQDNKKDEVLKINIALRPEPLIVGSGNGGGI